MGGKTEIRAKILGSHRTRAVEVEEWETTVWVQPLPFSLGHSLLQRARSNGADPDEGTLDMSLILDDVLIHGVIDEDGERVFTEDDRDEIQNLDFRPAMNVAMAVMEISGLTEKGAEEIEGN